MWSGPHTPDSSSTSSQQYRPSTTPAPISHPARRSPAKPAARPQRVYSDDVMEQSNALLQGTSPSSVDPVLFPDIISYLREKKAEMFSRTPPDYPSAQRSDDVCNALLLLMGQTTYCGLKSSECQRLQQKMDQANIELEKVLNERERCFGIFNKRRQRSIQKLQQQHDWELQAHDEHFSGDLPISHRHVSAEVLQLRDQERCLRQSRRYIEAQQMLEEADALEAFEMEKQKIRWNHEGMATREAILQKHAQQMNCVLEKAQQTWQALIPDSIAREKHWRLVIETLQRKIDEERGSSEEVEKTTRGILANEPQKLPSLGVGGIPMAWRRASFTNSKRAYSVGRVHRL